MPKIFINYRRSDTKSEARLLYQSLIEKFPREDVIMDIDTIPPTVDFKEYLDQAVAECDFLLAVIGPRWMETGTLHDESDWVRIEIEAALAQGKRIMPIIVNDGRMPRPDVLPKSLQAFAYKNGLPLDTGRDFALHVERITNWIEQLEAETKALRETSKPRSKTNARRENKKVRRETREAKENAPLQSEPVERHDVPFGMANQLYQIGGWRHYREDSFCIFWYGNGELALEVDGHLQAWDLREGQTEYTIVHGEKIKQTKFTRRFWEKTSDAPAIVRDGDHFQIKGFISNELSISVSPEAIRITDDSGFSSQIVLPRREARINHRNYLGEEFHFGA